MIINISDFPLPSILWKNIPIGHAVLFKSGNYYLKVGPKIAILLSNDYKGSHPDGPFILDMQDDDLFIHEFEAELTLKRLG